MAKMLKKNGGKKHLAYVVDDSAFCLFMEMD